MSCLTVEALGTVYYYQVIEENYNKGSISRLKIDCYDSDFLIFLKIISKPFDLPGISKPSTLALIDTVSAIYDSLLSISDDKEIKKIKCHFYSVGKVESKKYSLTSKELHYGLTVR